MKTLILFLWPMLFMAQTKFEKGTTAFDNQNYNQAINYFSDILEEEPSDKMARDYLGQSYAKLGNWEKSAEVAKTLVEDYPEDAEYNFRYGGALGLVAKNANPFKAMSLLDDVKFHLKKAIQLDPKHIESRWALLQIYLEIPGILGGSEDTSREYASQLKSISPVDGALANGYIERDQENFDKAEDFYNEAVELGQSETTYKELAELHKRSNQTTRRFEILEKGATKLNSLALASDYAKLAITLNKNKGKALVILEALNLDESNSKDKRKLEQLKSKLK
jgi:tetratricopeptide (TPR) repeat protein